MANKKKKKTSTKGLAGIPVYGSNSNSGEDIRLNKKVKPKKVSGIVNYLGDTETVTVPKQWLSSPDHVVAELAYITPAEQKILLEANLYGSLKGKPNSGPGGLMSLQGGGEQEAKDAGASNTSQASSSGSSGGGGGSSSSSSSSSSSDDGGAYDDDDADAELAEMFNQDVATRGRSVDTGRPSRAKFGGYDPSRDDEEQTSAITIRSYDPNTGKGGDFLSEQGRQDLNVLGEKAAEYFQGPVTKAIQKAEKFSPLAMLARTIGDVPSITRTKSGLAAGRIGAMQTGVQAGGIVKYDSAGNISHVEMPDGSKVGEKPTFDTSDSKDNSSPKPSTSGAPIPKAPPAVTPNAYYQKGVGTQTIDLSDPVQRRLYLQNLIGGTSSPIGGSFNPLTATYSMPDGGQRKVSGLDIFKRK